VRLLLITDWLRQRGGMETYFATLRAGLREAGHDARLLTSAAGDEAGGTAEYVAYGTDRRAPQVLLQIANPFALARVRSVVRQFRPDVALVGMVEQHLSPSVFAAVSGVPTMLFLGDYKGVCPTHSKLLPDGSLCRVRAGRVCMQGGCVSLPHWLRDRPRYALFRSGIGRVDRTLACSEWLRDALADEGIDSDVLLLPTSAPSPGYTRAPAAHPLFVFVGRLDREKGVDTLLHAFSRVVSEVPAARLRLAGDGEERASLQRLAYSLDLTASVDFLGRLTPADVEQELAGAWAAVAPSLWAEPLGLVAAEAIVRGVPVIASATGGLREIVADGRSGLLFPNGDIDALAGCLRAVAGGSATVGLVLPPDVVVEVANRHSVPRHVERVEQLCSEVLHRRAPGDGPASEL
jgi:glycosyltransferase involved in cell wall biosynthesis